jgi:hypothetical protein
LENTHPLGGGNISRCHWGKKYERAERKRRKMKKNKEEWGRKGKKMRKGEVKG